jgi:hypothetical protein
MRSFNHLRQTLEEAARDVERSARSGGSGRMNVSVRKNIKVATNVGRENGVTVASSTQTTPIHQNGGKH